MPEESTPSVVQRALGLLKSVRDRELEPEQIAQYAVHLAATLLRLAECHETRQDRRRAQMLSRLMRDPKGQVFTTVLTDRAHRSASPRQAVEQAQYLLSELGTPKYLNPLEQLQLGALRSLGSWVPQLTARALLDRIRDEARSYVLPGDPERLKRYLLKRRLEGTEVIVNHLGEEVTGEAQAHRRMNVYVELLQRGEVENISVKISGIYSQLSCLAFDASVEAIADRLRPIYRAALNHRRLDRSRNSAPKLVYLDMEAHRDLELTWSAFQRVLSEPEFQPLSAGIVLQAYVPESHRLQQRLLKWAQQRVASGGAPLRLRIVKGANLATERIESRLRGWRLATFESKREVDANYKRMLHLALQPEHATAVRVGVASHNLFDICYALILRSSLRVERQVDFELLEGMANPLRRSLKQLGADVLVYSPVVEDEDFPSAVAYLVRRFDENTAPENYLHHSFSMRVGDAAWESQKQAFLRACAAMKELSDSPRRVARLADPQPAPNLDAPFVNEPDTDFSLAENRLALSEHFARIKEGHYLVRSDICGYAERSRKTIAGHDPSRPGTDAYQIELADAHDVERALQAAESAAPKLQHLSPRARMEALATMAHQLRGARAELIALMVLDGGKHAEEADAEVSEAIDFAEYYARSYRQLQEDSGARLRPRGLTVVTPPWNFPLAIPMGGVFAALVTGNPVILKPAPQTPLVAFRALQLCKQAVDLPEGALQLVVCDEDVAAPLIADERVWTVVLTGATDTARQFLRLRPQLHLLAETGGKNALYVSSLSDRDQAIGDIVQSAFAHAGQKCSALSLLLLHHSLYDDAKFLAQLKDAAESMKVGSAWELDTRITPLIGPVNSTQRRAVEELASGESWLLKPRVSHKHPQRMTPGIKLGVSPDSYSHHTEFFCPVLSVMRVNDIDHALELTNATRYGLTSGIHSLDEREQRRWIDHVEAGNVYVNRKITGAIVGRQPFGGFKDSSFGPGAKAGGPNYLTQFIDPHALVSPTGVPQPREQRNSYGPLPAATVNLLKQLRKFSSTDVRERLEALAKSYFQTFAVRFATPSDPVGLPGEDNILRYLPVHDILVVTERDVSVEMLGRVLIAASIVGIQPRLACPAGAVATEIAPELVTLWDSETQLLQLLEEPPLERIRYLGTPSLEYYRAAHERGVHVTTTPPSASGRFELLHYLREQSACVTYHRYGNLGIRGLKRSVDGVTRGTNPTRVTPTSGVSRFRAAGESRSRTGGADAEQ